MKIVSLILVVIIFSKATWASCDGEISQCNDSNSGLDGGSIAAAVIVIAGIGFGAWAYKKHKRQESIAYSLNAKETPKNTSLMLSPVAGGANGLTLNFIYRY